MNKIPVQRTIYNNYSLWETYPDEDMKEALMENGMEEDEITDEAIWKERYFYDELDWEDAKIALTEFFNTTSTWMIFGEVGRWDGVYKAGKIFDFFDDFFYEATKDCDYWHFYDENGHLYLTCSHHDGTCHYEIKEVTDEGVRYLENWEDNWNDKRSEEYVHTQIFKRYSRLPRFAERIYGCKAVDYQPETKEAAQAKLALERLTQKPKVTFRALCVKDYYCLGYLAWEKGKVYEWIDGECTREDGMISSNYNSFSELIRCNTSYKDYFVELKDGDNPAEILKKYDEIKIGDMVTVVDYGCGYSTYKDWSGLGKYEQNFVYDKSISNGGKYKVLNIKKHDTFKDMIALVQDPETTQVFMIGIEGIKKIE